MRFSVVDDFSDGVPDDVGFVGCLRDEEIEQASGTSLDSCRDSSVIHSLGVQESRG